MPLHIACMYHLSHLHSKLFILAHEMVDREPENPISWYAVGVWYLSGQKWAQARQYFRFVVIVNVEQCQWWRWSWVTGDLHNSKTSLMDPRFGPAWVAFGHTFALEGEHDHAVTAYSTCARMFTGWVNKRTFDVDEKYGKLTYPTYRSHLPLMFVGMEHILLSNYRLADEALGAAYSMCDGDPLLINERAVMAFNHGEWALNSLLDILFLLSQTLVLRLATETTHFKIRVSYFCQTDADRNIL